MADTALPMPQTPGTGAHIAPLPAAIAEAPPMAPESGLLPDFAELLARVADVAKAETQPQAYGMTTPANGAVAISPLQTPLPQSIPTPMPATGAPLAQAASPEAVSTALSAHGQESDAEDDAPEAGETAPASPTMALPQLALPAPTPALAPPHTPSSPAIGTTAKHSADDAPSLASAPPSPAIARQDSASSSLLTASAVAHSPTQVALATDPIKQSLEYHDPASGSASPLAMTPPDQPATPSAPARATTPALSTAPGRFGEELGIAIARHIGRGEGASTETLTLRLDPPEHGRIEVTLRFEDGGPLRAMVAASQAGTLDLLRRDSADLSRALGQAGVGTDAQSFSFSAQSQSSGRERQGQSFGPQSAFPDARETAPDDALLPPAPDYRRAHTSGSLNLIA